jgi:hypothetical protein
VPNGKCEELNVSWTAREGGNLSSRDRLDGRKAIAAGVSKGIIALIQALFF